MERGGTFRSFLNLFSVCLPLLIDLVKGIDFQRTEVETNQCSISSNLTTYVRRSIRASFSSLMNHVYRNVYVIDESIIREITSALCPSEAQRIAVYIVGSIRYHRLLLRQKISHVKSRHFYRVKCFESNDWHIQNILVQLDSCAVPLATTKWRRICCTPYMNRKSFPSYFPWKSTRMQNPGLTVELGYQTIGSCCGENQR